MQGTGYRPHGGWSCGDGAARVQGTRCAVADVTVWGAGYRVQAAMWLTVWALWRDELAALCPRHEAVEGHVVDIWLPSRRLRLREEDGVVLEGAVEDLSNRYLGE